VRAIGAVNRRRRFLSARAAVAAAIVVFTSGILACATAMRSAGHPPNPTREEPPPGLSTRALAVGSRAPEFTLPATTGGRWSLASAVRKGPVVVLFYRGHW
jgi:hypothetical protein